MTESLQEMLDENIRFGGGFNGEFLSDVRDFLLQTYIKCENYHLTRKN